mgnify:CR=1 FL=1
MKLSGWGKYPILETEIFSPNNIDELIQLVKNGDSISRGNGRSYGDSSIGRKTTISMSNFNKIISFDDKLGLITAEAGVLLKNIIDFCVPKGWFPYVTPGSKYVSLGGMIAANVHGKNHHIEGNFSEYVEWIDIVDSDGILVRCSREKNSDLFEWTMGTMGLTGVIIRAAFRLRKIETSWIKQKKIIVQSLDEAINVFESHENSTYSVAWIDCLKKKNFGRSVIIIGEHAKIKDLKNKMKTQPFKTSREASFSIPFFFPSWFLNSWFVKIFNSIYFWVNKKNKGNQLIDLNSFFYPLDKILKWNKIYGKRGFAQFQCVIPIKNSKPGLNELLKTIQSSNVGSFLTVLKKFGKEKGKFSFPMEGFTLALDFPINQKSLDLMSELDKITLKFGGRFYLAKDSRMSKETFNNSEKRLEDFKNFRKKLKNNTKFNSVQSERLGL